MKKVLKGLLAIFLITWIMPAASAYNSQQHTAALFLNELGLFNGVGTKADGTPNYNLDAKPTRDEAITMLVRLIGKEDEAKKTDVNIPFTDVEEWAKPYVSYAYNNGLAKGLSATTFGGKSRVNSAQYLTFALRALGYSDDTDFSYNSVWSFSDKLKLTNQQYNKNTTNFTRGDVALISYNALKQNMKDGSSTLVKKLIDDGTVNEDFMSDVRLTKEAGLEIYPTPTNVRISTVRGKTFVFWDTVKGTDYGYDVEFKKAQDGSFHLFSWGGDNHIKFGVGNSFSIEPNTKYYFRVRVHDVIKNESTDELRSFYSAFSDPVLYDYTKTYAEEPDILTQYDYDAIRNYLNKAIKSEQEVADFAYRAYNSSYGSSGVYYILNAKNSLGEEWDSLCEITKIIEGNSHLEPLLSSVYPLYLITGELYSVTPTSSTYRRFAAQLVAVSEENMKTYQDALQQLSDASDYFVYI